MMESPEAAREIVLQAVVAERQVSLSLPLTPFTYQVLARAAGANTKDRAIVISLVLFRLISCLRFEVRLLGPPGKF
jgi:hypothetical protein